MPVFDCSQPPVPPRLADNWNGRTNSKASNLKHSLIQEVPCLPGWDTPGCVQDTHRCPLPVLPLSTEKAGGKGPSPTAKQQKQETIHYNASEGEAVKKRKLLQGNTRKYYVALLKECAEKKDSERGHRLHVEIADKGLLETDVFVGSTIVSMYARCGLPSEAQEVFDQLPVRDVVSWNALISGYAQHALADKALSCFELMQLEGVSPNAVTFVCSLKACAILGATDKGQEIHSSIVQQGLLQRNILVGTALVDMYAKCGLLGKAQEVFDSLLDRDVVLWNALIAGYVGQGRGKEAMNCYEQMQLEGISPNAVSFVCGLKACAIIGAIDKGCDIHSKIAKTGLLARDHVVGNALVDMYTRWGLLEKAKEVFDNLPIRGIVSWNTLIAGYSQHGYGEEALQCYEQMQLEGFSPDAFTFVCSLKACGIVGALDKGQGMHAEIAKKGLMEINNFVGTALVDMYANCGLLTKAQQVFDKLQVRDLILWNTLITGYAQLGQIENVVHIFYQLVSEGFKPSGVTFISVLMACSHAGLMEKGEMFFQSMSIYGISPSLDHHKCMVDLYGRAGQLDKALFIAKRMLFEADLVVWHTLLGACQKWGNMKLASEVFEHAVQLDDKDTPAYVCLSNVYLEAGILEDADEVEEKPK